LPELGQGHAIDGGKLAASAVVLWGIWWAWSWTIFPHQVSRTDGSVKDVTAADLAYQVHPGHAGLG